MEKKKVINDFKNSSNEKQNSLTSRIRIGCGSNFPILKQQFAKIKEVGYSTSFEFFLQNQLHVIVNKDKSCSICSSIEKRAFYKGVNFADNALIYHLIETIHRDIITFKFGGDLVYKLCTMQNERNKLPIRWIFRLAIIALASYVTGLIFPMCIITYIGIMFLIRFSLNMLVIILGAALMVSVFLVLFLVLLAL